MVPLRRVAERELLKSRQSRRRRWIPVTAVAVALLALPACSSDRAATERPAPDTRGWTALPAPPLQVPVLRTGQAAVWTGEQALVWGGTPPNPCGSSNPVVHADGAAWDPVTTSWTAMAPAPVGAREGASLLWTGRGAVLVGGRGAIAECHTRPAGALDAAVFTPGPGGGSWTKLPDLPWPAGTEVAANAWTDQQVLVWSPVEGGLSLRLGERAWQPVSALPGDHHPRSREELTSSVARDVWTGTRWLVWSSVGYGTSTTRQAWAYDPATGTQRSIDVGPALERGAGVVRAGQGVLAYVPESGVWRYDAANDRWTQGAKGPLQQVRRPLRGGPELAWTGHRLLVWGGPRSRDAGRCTDGDGMDDSVNDYGGACNPATGPLGAAYDPATDTWQVITDGPWQRRVDSAVAWTGSSMLLAGGVDLEQQRDGRGTTPPDDPGAAAVTFTPASTSPSGTAAR